jgi:hypothetical protein
VRKVQTKSGAREVEQSPIVLRTPNLDINLCKAVYGEILILI